MVEGGYTATELKTAHYTAIELREVGFSAGALKVAAFTSRQLHEAGYTLKQLYKGNYPWQDLVIFLRFTHAELTAAGYRDLDPKHRLFLEYRPEHDEEMGAPASPRSHPASPMASPRAYPEREQDPRSMRVGDAPLVLRAGADLTSEKLRQVPKGTPVEVLELRQGEGQQMRARIRYEAKGFMWFSEGFKGWVTSVQADGVHLLVAPTLNPSRPTCPGRRAPSIAGSVPSDALIRERRAVHRQTLRREGQRGAPAASPFSAWPEGRRIRGWIYCFARGVQTTPSGPPCVILCGPPPQPPRGKGLLGVDGYRLDEHAPHADMRSESIRLLILYLRLGPTTWGGTYTQDLSC